MTARGGNGRRLTYRERWEHLREWASDPYSWCSSEGLTSVKLRDYMEKLDHTTLVKARPVRTRKGRKP